MTNKGWKKLSDELIKKNPWWEYRVKTFKMPSGQQKEYHYPKLKNGSMVVALNDKGKVLLIRIYRPIIEEMSIAFPAGGREQGESFLATAKRELAEETDFGARSFEELGVFQSTPGSSTETAHVFIAYDLYTETAKKDETEDLETFWATPEEVDRMIFEGELKDGWAICSWFFARPRILELRASLPGAPEESD